MTATLRHDTPSTRAPVLCPACGGRTEPDPLYALEGVPVQSTLLLASREEAESFPTGDLELRFCPGCGLAFNCRFHPGAVRYGIGYEDSQAASPTFLSYANALARDWIDRYALRGGHLAEIGCGKGDFLRLICAEGGCTGIGFDSAYTPSPHPPGLSFLAENFDDSRVPLEADFVICRHTLEHIADVAGFLGLMRRACASRPRIRLGFEVPDLRRILAEAAFWDIYYEHANYFTAGSLARAFELAGFRVLDVRRVYGDQYLVLEAAPADAGAASLPRTDDIEVTAALVQRFRTASSTRIDAWRRRFAAWRQSGRRVALWGSGSKAVGFLTTVGDPGNIACVVDINPRRQGLYMPHCAVPIVAPTALPSRRTDVVVLMNPVYRDEIAAQIRAMSIAPEVRTVEDPPAEELRSAPA